MRTPVVVLLAFIVALLLWGVAVEPRLMIDEERWVVRLPGVDPAWEGRPIALIADLQVGMWWDNTGTIRRIVERLVEQEPTLVLIAGDFIYHPLGEPSGRARRDRFSRDERAEAARVIREAVELVKPLPRHGIPTYAVLGNHDYGMESRRAARLDWLARDLEVALEESGIPVLKNEAVAVPPAGDRASGQRPALHLVGVGSHYARYDHPAEALEQVPPGAPRLVLMHHPETFRRIEANAAPLAFAGHTHGGQISIPGTPRWSWMSLLNPDEVHADGWIDGFGAPGNRLYVNRGIGFSVVPMRVAAPPEITWIELRSAPVGSGSIREP